MQQFIATYGYLAIFLLMLAESIVNAFHGPSYIIAGIVLAAIVAV